MNRFFCWSLIIKYNLHTSQMYIWIIKTQHEESKSTGSGLNNESILYLNCVTLPIASMAGTPVVSHKEHSCTPWKKKHTTAVPSKKETLLRFFQVFKTTNIPTKSTLDKLFRCNQPIICKRVSLLPPLQSWKQKKKLLKRGFPQLHLFLYHFQRAKCTLLKQMVLPILPSCGTTCAAGRKSSWNCHGQTNVACSSPQHGSIKEPHPVGILKEAKG